jgi:hypothetical protein
MGVKLLDGSAGCNSSMPGRNLQLQPEQTRYVFTSCEELPNGFETRIVYSHSCCSSLRSHREHSRLIADHRHNHSYSHHASRKLHVSGHGDGRYVNGRGKSHKGGHYENRRTGNHYQDRKAGVPH